MLNEQEKNYGDELIQYYSSPINRDQKKVSDFIYADEKGKQIMIKEFLNAVINPTKEVELGVYQSKVSELSQSITSISAYTK